MKVVTSAQMREIDQFAIENLRIPSLRLMENAGQLCAEKIVQHYPNARSFIFFCGKGNNGGDGFVCARHLHSAGYNVHVILLARYDDVKDDARTNLDAYLSLETKPTFFEVTTDEYLRQSLPYVAAADVIVDAILGTGATGPLRSIFGTVVELINNSGKPVVSIDIPSGLDPDKGTSLGKFIQPSLTLMLGLPKLGLVIFPGAKYVKQYEILDIGIPEKVIHQKKNPLNLTTTEECASLLPQRDPESHKGKFGHVLVLAGSPGFTGAAAMTSLSALRAGAGLVTLGIPASLQNVLSAKLTEVMTLALPETAKHTLDINAEFMITEFFSKANVLAVGPGLSLAEPTQSLVRKIVLSSPIPVVLDADGITAFAISPAVFNLAKSPIVMTPHTGELARLMHLSASDLKNNRINYAHRFAREHNVFLVLKGARTIIAEPSGQIYLNPTGNSGMATAGSGDVLTGMIAGLMAQGLSPLESCILATYLHGYAGDLAANNLTEYCLIAGDLINYLPAAFKHLIKIRDS